MKVFHQNRTLTIFVNSKITVNIFFKEAFFIIILIFVFYSVKYVMVSTILSVFYDTNYSSFRIYCLQTFVKITVLTCSDIAERATILSQWIQVAMETRGAVCNWFAFENVMEGLMSQEVRTLLFSFVYSQLNLNS